MKKKEDSEKKSNIIEEETNILNDEKKPDAEQKTQQTEKKKKKGNGGKLYILKVFIMTFMLSFVFSIIAEILMSGGSLFLAFLIVAILLVISIIFDTIGVAVTSCDIEPFLSMAARKEKGAKTAVNLLKKAERVSSFCNDVIGDICGIVSGVASASIVAIFAFTGMGNLIVSVVVSSLLSAFTVGGKAIGKKVAISKSHSIVYGFAKFLAIFKREKNK